MRIGGLPKCYGGALAVLLLVGPVAAFGAGITYHGRLIDPTGRAVVGNSVQFRIQIRTPGPENCLFYEEQQTKDLSHSSGVFAITINDGTATVINTEPYTLDRVFQNRGHFNFGSGKCAGATSTYSPNPADGRKISVDFNDGSFTGWEPMPSQAINFVPMAIESMSVGGYDSRNLMRVHDGGGDPVQIPALTEGQFQGLLQLADGTSSSYLQAGASLNGADLLAASVPGAAIVSLDWSKLVNVPAALPQIGALSCADGKILKRAGGAWGCGDDDAGGGFTEADPTVQAFSRNPPGTGLIVNGSDRIQADFGTGAGKVVEGNDPRLSDARLPTTHSHKVGDIASDNGNYFTYRPNNGACAVGEVLKWDNGGGGRWICGTDITTSGGGGGVNSLSGTAPILVDNADPSNPRVEIDASVVSSANSVVQRDGAGAIQSAGANFGLLQVNNGASTITIGTPAAFTSYVLKLPSGTGTNGQILTSNGTDMIWSTPAADASKVNKAGDAMTGPLSIWATGQTTANMNTAANLGGLLLTDAGGAVGNGGAVVFGMNSGGTSKNFAAIKSHVIDAVGNGIGHLAFSTRGATGDATLTERLRITNAGNVGIGTTAPGAKLEVAGGIKLGSMTPCTGTEEGSQRYNSTLKIMEFCDGTAWQSFAGTSAIPSGAVMAFNLASCPSGWTAMSAAAGRFIVGRGSLGLDSYTLGATGGASTVTLTAAQMPSHTHSIDPPATSTSSAGDHSHTMQGLPNAAGLGFGAGNGVAYGTKTTDAAGAHTHTVDIAAFTSGSAGSGQAHENRPPYLALLICQKN